VKKWRLPVKRKGRRIHSRITDGQDRTVYLGANVRMANAIWGVMLIKSGVVSPRSFPAWPFRRGRRVLANRLSGAKAVMPDNWRETGDVMITDIINILSRPKMAEREEGMKIPKNLKDTDKNTLKRMVRAMQKAIAAECRRCMGVETLRGIQGCGGFDLDDGKYPLYEFSSWANR